MTRLSPADLAGEVDRLAENLDGLRRSAAVFWIDAYAAVPAPPGLSSAELCRLAERSYQGGLPKPPVRVTAAEPLPPGEDWTKPVSAKIREMGHFDRLFPGTARRAPEFLVDWLFLLVEDALGPLRVAAHLTIAPFGWHAALWDEWLLVGEAWAVVLSLTNDS